jgi:hypothetical protein
LTPNRFKGLKVPGTTVADDYLDFGWGNKHLRKLFPASVQSDESQLTILVGWQICPIDVMR